MNKSELRKYYLQKRNEATGNVVKHSNASIIESLKKEINFSSPHCLHLFLPINQHREINLWPLIHWIWENSPSIQVVVPKSDFKTREMISYLLTPQTELTTENHGIPEPLNGTIIQNERIDTVITPLIICDKKGHRVGYGKGFYDTFFKTTNENTKRIGIGYFEPIDNIENTDYWDIPLTQYISPTKIYIF